MKIKSGKDVKARDRLKIQAPNSKVYKGAHNNFWDLVIFCFTLIGATSFGMDGDNPQGYKLTPEPVARKLDKQFYDKQISVAEKARNGDPSAQAQAATPLTQAEQSKVRMPARKLPGATRNTGYDEILQTAETSHLKQRDAGLVPGIRPTGTVNGEKVSHLGMQRDVRVSTAFMPLRGEQGGIMGGHPGTFSKDPSNSSYGLTKGSPEFHAQRQAYLEKSSNPVSMAARGLISTLKSTANREDFEKGYVGDHNGPVYDLKSRDIKKPENLAEYAREYGQQRNDMKRALQTLYDQSDAESVTTYVPSSEWSDSEIRITSPKIEFKDSARNCLSLFSSDGLSGFVRRNRQPTLKEKVSAKRHQKKDTKTKKRQKKDSHSSETEKEDSSDNGESSGKSDSLEKDESPETDEGYEDSRISGISEEADDEGSE